jgi:uncharacterized protein (TIGR00725 family)
MTELTRRSAQATVIGDAAPASVVVEAAEQVGGLLGHLGITLVTGGLGGVMEGASRGARKAGGTVVGIIPSRRMEDANPWCNVVIPTDLGHARNILTVLAGDFVISIGGGAGTLSEICLAWVHGKPIFVLQGFGGWSDRLDGSPLDHRRSSTIKLCQSLEELEKAILEYCRSLEFPVTPG